MVLSNSISCFPRRLATHHDVLFNRKQRVFGSQALVPRREQACSGTALRKHTTAIPRGPSLVMSGNGATACPEEFIKAALELADVAAEITTQYFRSDKFKIVMTGHFDRQMYRLLKVNIKRGICCL